MSDRFVIAPAGLLLWWIVITNPLAYLLLIGAMLAAGLVVRLYRA